MIHGGQVANASARHRKQERREVCSVKVVLGVCFIAKDPKEREHLWKIFSGASDEVIT